jgi:hypothetical protein
MPDMMRRACQIENPMRTTVHTSLKGELRLPHPARIETPCSYIWIVTRDRFERQFINMTRANEALARMPERRAPMREVC